MGPSTTSAPPAMLPNLPPFMAALPTGRRRMWQPCPSSGAQNGQPCAAPTTCLQPTAASPRIGHSQQVCYQEFPQYFPCAGSNPHGYSDIGIEVGGWQLARAKGLEIFWKAVNLVCRLACDQGWFLSTTRLFNALQRCSVSLA